MTIVLRRFNTNENILVLSKWMDSRTARKLKTKKIGPCNLFARPSTFPPEVDNQRLKVERVGEIMAAALQIDLRDRWPGLLVAAQVARALGPQSADAMDEAPSSPTDLEDIRRCLRGDGEAYRRLVQRHQAQVAAILWRFSRDAETHEELVQDVFVEAYVSLSGYRAHAPFSHWLSRIATRVGFRFWKRQARKSAHPTVPLEEWDQLPPELPDALSPSEAADLVHRLLAQLPPRDRLVLTLRYLDGHDVDATARLTGWSRTLVKVQTWRARNKLKRLFEQAQREEDR
jgi:RNA polymerase sigma-70 factor (ECF subfamily)